MKKLEAVLFDVDGVLVDSREANAAFFANLVEDAGYSRPSREAVNEYFHLTMWQAIGRLIGTEDPTAIEPIWRRGNDPANYPSDLLEFPPDLVRVLSELREVGYRQGIVTGRVRAGVDVVYSAAPIADFFEVAVAAEDYSRPKPDPEPLEVALARLSLLASQAVYIGDSPTDIESAKSLGMPSIHLAPVKHPDATIGITNFSQIPGAVAKLTSTSN